MDEGSSEKGLIRRLVLINTFLLIILFGLIGFIAVQVIQKSRPLVYSDTKLNERTAKLQIDLAELNQNVETLHEQIMDLSDKTLSTDNMQDVCHNELNLPAEYVNLVKNFFKTKEVNSLLSEKAKKLGAWQFGEPVFIDLNYIYVDYFSPVNRYQESMILNITIVDLYVLQFNVTWDSLEGR